MLYFRSELVFSCDTTSYWMLFWYASYKHLGSAGVCGRNLYQFSSSPRSTFIPWKCRYWEDSSCLLPCLPLWGQVPENFLGETNIYIKDWSSCSLHIFNSLVAKLFLMRGRDILWDVEFEDPYCSDLFSRLNLKFWYLKCGTIKIICNQ